MLFVSFGDEAATTKEDRQTTAGANIQTVDPACAFMFKNIFRWVAMVVEQCILLRSLSWLPCSSFVYKAKC